VKGEKSLLVKNAYVRLQWRSLLTSHLSLLACCLALTSCRRGMVDQQHLKPLAEETFFANGAGSRMPPEHTVARGHLRQDEQLFTGKIGEQLVATIPMPVTREILAHGRERFDVYCAVCHGRTGEGNGMIVQRGFPQPPSLHEQRLRDAPIGHFFDVMTNGYGVMYPYASRVAAEDRWAVAAYIRALQFSEHASAADVDPAAWDVKSER
jgi:mono/diheme cytochrome c family protein